MTQTTNPLKAWFRQPAIYIRLPSAGEYWPNDSIQIPQNGELPVMPMTALDEITYRTPDALFNGQAVVSVIESCVPSIKNAWHAPALDINSLLISIRIASYGHELEITSTCPACNESNDYGLDMRIMLDNLTRPDYSTPVKNGEIEVFFKPMTFQQQTQVSMDQFDTQRAIAAAQESTVPEDQKAKAMAEVMKKINLITTRALSFTIAGIRAPSAFVENIEHISEFLANCDRAVYNAIRDRAVEIRGTGEIKPVKITCADCKHQYDQAIELNMSDFFVTAS